MPYIEECCHVLEESKEHLDDVYLTHLVRLWNLTEKTPKILVPEDGIDQPLSMHMQMVRSSVLGRLFFPPGFFIWVRIQNPSQTLNTIFSRM